MPSMSSASEFSQSCFSTIFLFFGLWFLHFSLFDKRWTFNNTPRNTDISRREMKIMDGKYWYFYFTRTQKCSFHKKVLPFPLELGRQPCADNTLPCETNCCRTVWQGPLENNIVHRSFVVCCLYIVCEVDASEQHAPPVASICWHDIMNKCDFNTPY